MISVDRNRVKLPPQVQAQLLNGRNAAKQFYHDSAVNAQSRYLPDEKILLATLDALTSLFFSKCAFCETAIRQPHIRNIVHFRPPSNARDFKGVFSPEHYWWLIYEWRNLYLACARCNQSQGTLFPVEAHRAMPNASYGRLVAERPLLIDPCIDEPSRYLRFSEEGKLNFVSEQREIDRGYATINIFDLNRKELLAEREYVAFETRRLVTSINDEISRGDLYEIASQVNEIFAPTAPYLGLRRQLLADANDPRTWNHLRTFLPRNHNLKFLYPTSQDEPYRLSRSIDAITDVDVYPEPTNLHKTIYCKRLVLKNFRGIADLDLGFSPAEDESRANEELVPAIEHSSATSEIGWKVFLGENGCGKTSVLRAIAIALAGKDRYESELGTSGVFTPERFLNRNYKSRKAEGFIRLELSDDKDPIVVEFDNRDYSFSSRPEGCPDVFVRGYGATRIVEHGTTFDLENKASDAFRILNLFDPREGFIEPMRWLDGLDEKAFDYAGKTLRDILHIPDVVKPIIEKKRSGVNLRVDTGKALPITDYSHGYRSVLTLVADIFAGTPDSLSDKRLASGVVLLDELDLHLHPKWKMQIVKALRTAFPRMQFITTTHEPLCLRGLKAREIAVMTRVGHIVEVNDAVPSPEGLRVDQLLTSPLFGLESTIDPGVDQLFQEYYRLLSRVKLTKAQKARRDLLVVRIKNYNTLGFTRRDQLVYQLIDQFLAENPAGFRAAELDAVTKRKIWDLWQYTLPSDGQNPE